jgi:hypothetical protein
MMFRPRYTKESMQKLGRIIEVMVNYHNKIIDIKLSSQPEAPESLVNKYADLVAMKSCIAEIENILQEK